MTRSGAVETRHPNARRVTWLVIGVGVLLGLVAASFAFGTRVVSLSEIGAGLTGDTSSVGAAAVVLRVPRTVLALVVGAMLAVSGATLQGVTRNPLADPGILGISFGASLAVVIGIAMFGITSPVAFTIAALVGATAASVFVYVVGSLGYGGTTPLKLALAGAATAAACTSLIAAVLLPRVDLLETFRRWQVGGVGGADWANVGMLLLIAVIGIVGCFALARGLNTLALGDDVAAGLGQHVARTRLLGWAGAVLLTAAATAAVGPIAFVGLVVAHVCRIVFGPDYRWIIPTSVIGGAALLIAADVVGRVVARPEEVEVGIVVAFIGAPFFIWIVRRQKVREL